MLLFKLFLSLLSYYLTLLLFDYVIICNTAQLLLSNESPLLQFLKHE